MGLHTIDFTGFRFHMNRLDRSIVDNECVTLGTGVPKDLSRIKGEVQLFCEFAGRITQEADL